jgi:hypothetical protein
VICASRELKAFDVIDVLSDLLSLRPRSSSGQRNRTAQCRPLAMPSSSDRRCTYFKPRPSNGGRPPAILLPLNASRRGSVTSSEPLANALSAWCLIIEVVRSLVWLVSLEDGQDGKASEARGSWRQAMTSERSDLKGPESHRRNPCARNEFSEVRPVAI